MIFSLPVGAKHWPDPSTALRSAQDGQYFARYERGQADIPISELDRLARMLGTTLPSFVQEERARKGVAEVTDAEAWGRLPPEVRTFIMEPNSLPYLRMAMKFRDMPKARLKELGEILLVVR